MLLNEGKRTMSAVSVGLQFEGCGKSIYVICEVLQKCYNTDIYFNYFLILSSQCLSVILSPWVAFQKISCPKCIFIRFQPQHRRPHQPQLGPRENNTVLDSVSRNGRFVNDRHIDRPQFLSACSEPLIKKRVKTQALYERSSTTNEKLLVRIVSYIHNNSCCQSVIPGYTTRPRSAQPRAEVLCLSHLTLITLVFPAILCTVAGAYK